MKVLFLTQMDERGPSSRYRVYQLLPLLKQKGIDPEVSPGIEGELYETIYSRGYQLGKWKALPVIWKKRQSDVRRLHEFDAVFIQKGILPGLYSGLEKKMAREKPIVFDFDDAIWLPRQGGSRVARFMHREAAVKELLRLSSAVIAGNDFLADYASHYNRNVTVVPTAVDVSRYPKNRSSEVVGWIGSAATLPYLKSVGGVFQRLNIRPRVIGVGNPGSLGFDVEYRPWHLGSEAWELSQIGIGISPLPDTPWERGKCGVKLLQYMACGIPVVASPVGVHHQMVRSGENGFLAHSEEQWVGYLASLMKDAQLRDRMGERGRAFVQQDYDVHGAADKIASILLKVGA